MMETAKATKKNPIKNLSQNTATTTTTSTATSTSTTAPPTTTAAAALGPLNTATTTITSAVTTTINQNNLIVSTTSGPSSGTSSVNSSNGSNNVSGASIGSSIGSSTMMMTANTIPLLQTMSAMDLMNRTTTEDSNNVSLTSGISEGQRSLSAAPSASSSPILSPTGKVYGRNANGTMVATNRPNNEAEIQLYRVLQKASLLAYFDTLLEMGGDDVQQLYEAGEEEFLEIMALVGMASKPLHVRRLQKVLHEWANNPQQFQTPIPYNPGQFETAAKATIFFNSEQSPFNYQARSKLTNFQNTTAAAFVPAPLINTIPHQTSGHLLSQICNLPSTLPTYTTTLPVPISVSVPIPSTTLSASLNNERPQILINNNSNSNNTPTISAAAPTSVGMTAPNATHQVTSSSPQLTPILSEMQVARIKMGAEKIATQLPKREPRAHTSKKRTSRELEQIIAMDESDPRRMDEIRKYSAIYGRFDCKRRPEKPLTLHEVCVNEAAAQLCRLAPTLLTRRDELFPLARQIVKDAGFGHSATIARYGHLLNHMAQTASTNVTTTSIVSATTTRSSNVTIPDCESTESNPSASKRQRLCSTESIGSTLNTNTNTNNSTTTNRETQDDCRYNLFAIYQKFSTRDPFNWRDFTKYPLNKSLGTDFEQQDNETRFCFNNSHTNSPYANQADLCDTPNAMDRNCNSNPATAVTDCHNCLEEETCATVSSVSSSVSSLVSGTGKRNLSTNNNNYENDDDGAIDPATGEVDVTVDVGGLTNEVQVLSACGNHIIAVANPALLLSPTLNDSMNSLNRKREIDSSDFHT